MQITYKVKTTDSFNQYPNKKLKTENRDSLLVTSANISIKLQCFLLCFPINMRLLRVKLILITVKFNLSINISNLTV